MRRCTVFIRCIAAVLLACSGITAHAGRACEMRHPSVDTVQRAMVLAERTARWLDASGADVVVLARAGQDLSRYGLAYSHLGFAYREGAAWRVAHKLNHCGGARASLYRQGLGDFFLDDLWRHEAAVVVPAPQVQALLAPALRDDRRLAQLDTPA